MTDKPTLRKTLRAARREYCTAMSEADRRRAFSIMPGVMKPLFADRPIVAGYAAVGNESNPAMLLTLAHEMGCETALPFFADRDALMQFRCWRPGEPLDAAPFGGGQPQPDASVVAPDFLIMPLIGFDRTGNRVGQGGGHYDRALASLPKAVAIGIAWSVQEAGLIPADPWDMPLHHILTEREWITPMRNRP